MTEEKLERDIRVGIVALVIGLIDLGIMLGQVVIG